MRKMTQVENQIENGSVYKTDYELLINWLTSYVCSLSTVYLLCYFSYCFKFETILSLKKTWLFKTTLKIFFAINFPAILQFEPFSVFILLHFY